MPTLLVRDVDELLVRKLHQRAKANGRSAAEEHRQILREALSGASRPDIQELVRQVRSLTAGRKHTPAEVLIREGRDER